MPGNAKPLGTASWVAILKLIDVLEQRHPGLRATTLSRARAALQEDTGDNAAFVRAILCQLEAANAAADVATCAINRKNGAD